MSLVSIIIPVHNTEAYLRRCVESVLRQTLKNIEIILVENGSTDNSAVLCDQLARQDSRIKVIHLPVGDLSVARNTGIDAASSPYIGFVDSDDHVEETMYADMLHAMIEYQADIVYCNYLHEYEDGSLEKQSPDTGKSEKREMKVALYDILYDRIASSPCDKLYKRELFEITRFPEFMIFEDRATLYKWFSLCSSLCWIDKSYYYYFIRSGSICRSLDFRAWRDYFMSEYGRFCFVRDSLLFTEEERMELLIHSFSTASRMFKSIVKLPDRKGHASEIKALIPLLREFLIVPWSAVGLKNKFRLWKLTHYRMFYP